MTNPYEVFWATEEKGPGKLGTSGGDFLDQSRGCCDGVWQEPLLTGIQERLAFVEPSPFAKGAQHRFLRENPTRDKPWGEGQLRCTLVSFPLVLAKQTTPHKRGAGNHTQEKILVNHSAICVP